MDTVLNFLYVVAFLAAMVLPAFQRQRRETARKKAEAQRKAEEIPTVEERSPEDVPAPVVRRTPVPAAAAPASAGAGSTAASTSAPSAGAATGASAAEAEPEAAANPEVASAAARKVGQTDLTHIDDEIDLTALDDELDITALDVPQVTEPEGAEAAERAMIRDDVRTATTAISRPNVLDRVALRQAWIWRELLGPPLALRSRRDPRE